MRQSKSAELSKMLQELHQLHQQNDVSREEECQIQFDNQSSIYQSSLYSSKQYSLHKDSPNSSSKLSSHAFNMHKINRIEMLPISQISDNFSKSDASNQNSLTIQVKGGGLGQMCRKSAESKWDRAPSKLVQNDNVNKIGRLETEIKGFKQQNRKLLEDNKSLLYECIHLRKIINSSASECILQYEKNRIQMLHEINKLKSQSCSLMAQLNSHTTNSGCKSQETSEEILRLLKNVNADNEKIAQKIEELEIKFGNRKCEALKNSNGFTFSTEESKYSEQDHLNKEMINSFVKTHREKKSEEEGNKHFTFQFQSHICAKQVKMGRSPFRNFQK